MVSLHSWRTVAKTVGMCVHICVHVGTCLGAHVLQMAVSRPTGIWVMGMGGGPLPLPLECRVKGKCCHIPGCCWTLCSWRALNSWTSGLLPRPTRNPARAGITGVHHQARTQQLLFLTSKELPQFSTVTLLIPIPTSSLQRRIPSHSWTSALCILSFWMPQTGSLLRFWFVFPW